MIRVQIKETELIEKRACAGGLALFAAIATNGVWEGDWTIVHALWLALGVPKFSRWLINRELIPSVCYYRANLYRANLEGANLEGANLRGANIYGANLGGALAAGRTK